MASLRSDSLSTIVLSAGGTGKRRNSATIATGSVALKIAPTSSAVPMPTEPKRYTASATSPAVIATPGTANSRIGRQARFIKEKSRFHAASKMSAGKNSSSVAQRKVCVRRPGWIWPTMSPATKTAAICQSFIDRAPLR